MAVQETRVAVALRPMGEDDLDSVLAIEGGSFETPWTRTHFRDELKNADLSVPRLALFDGQVVGYTVTWIIVDECHLANIAVHPDFRGLGIGRVLLEDVLELARDRSCGKVCLEVRRSNKTAIRLYESFGFRVVGVRKNYYHDGFLRNEDAILMDLALKPGSPA